MPKRRVKERRRRALEFKRLAQVHGGRKKFQPPPSREQMEQELIKNGERFLDALARVRSL